MESNWRWNVFDVGWQGTDVKFVGIRWVDMDGTAHIITDQQAFNLTKQYRVPPGELPIFETLLVCLEPKFPWGYAVGPD